MRTPAGLLGVSILALAGCPSDDVVCPSAEDFRLTAPAGFAELVHGGTVTVAWTAGGTDGASVALVATSTDGGPAFALPPANLGDGQVAWDGTGSDGAVAPPGNYRLSGTAGEVGGCTGAPITGGDGHLIVIQGVILPGAPITLTGSQATRAVAVTTVTRSTLDIGFALDPSAATDGDELVFVQAAVPGELAPVRRMIPFAGTTASGIPIAAGDYDLVALIGDPIAYRVTGPRVAWRPAD